MWIDHSDFDQRSGIVTQKRGLGLTEMEPRLVKSLDAELMLTGTERLLIQGRGGAGRGGASSTSLPLYVGQTWSMMVPGGLFYSKCDQTLF